jgi:hypothetical protein
VPPFSKSLITLVNSALQQNKIRKINRFSVLRSVFYHQMEFHTLWSQIGPKDRKCSENCQWR